MTTDKNLVGTQRTAQSAQRDRTARPVAQWDTRKEEALQAIVVYSLPQKAAAQQVGVSVRTLNLWEKTDAWRERRRQVFTELQGAILQEGIANQTERIHRRNKDWGRLRSIQSDRGEYYRQKREDGDESIPPGADTGLLVPIPTVGGGTKWTVDKAALDAMEALERDTAQELGQIASSGNRKSDGNEKGMVVYLETGDALPSYALGTEVDALESCFALMEAGLMPSIPEECERIAFRIGRRMCGWRDDEPWDWDPELLKAVKDAGWSMPPRDPAVQAEGMEKARKLFPEVFEVAEREG